jgi:hypothetical protein
MFSSSSSGSHSGSSPAPHNFTRQYVKAIGSRAARPSRRSARRASSSSTYFASAVGRSQPSGKLGCAWTFPIRRLWPPVSSPRACASAWRRPSADPKRETSRRNLLDEGVCLQLPSTLYAERYPEGVPDNGRRARHRPRAVFACWFRVVPCDSPEAVRDGFQANAFRCRRLVGGAGRIARRTTVKAWQPMRLRRRPAHYMTRA